MMYTEDELLPISALSHIVFCERRAALIHLEGAWEENRLTAEGRQMHEKVHEGGPESRAGVRIARGLRLRSLALGLAGQADVVEFHEKAGIGCRVSGIEDPDSRDEKSTLRSPQSQIVYPVEYKRGRPKPERCDEVQLCAQALCLEEMLRVTIEDGAIFYGQPRRRQEVVFDAALREETKVLAARMHALFAAGLTPPARYEKKCEQCSLKEVCLPKTAAARKSAQAYVDDFLEEMG